MFKSGVSNPNGVETQSPRLLYSATSVSQSNLDRVKTYITNQERHHQKISFQDELRALFRKHELEWDERYVWD